MNDSCNSFCLPSWLCQHWALRPVLRCRVCDVSQCSPSCCLLALQLCVQAGVVAYITKRLSGASQPTLLAISVRVFCQRCRVTPLAFQVPLCDDSSILILHLSFVSQHCSRLSTRLSKGAALSSVLTYGRGEPNERLLALYTVSMLPVQNLSKGSSCLPSVILDP